jgi:pimeloyl-ACP methyl ester carboxylesterase
MPRLNRDGVQLHYEVHGAGPVILLTHGYSATAQMWHGQIEPLGRKHTLVLWDMRGHGASDYPTDQSAYGEAATVADMAALLDAVGARTAVLGGLSLGGYMSLSFHRAHPQRVKALMIIDTGPGYRSDTAREDWNRRAIARAERLERDGLAALGTSREVLASRHRSAEGLARAARGMLTQHNSAVIDSLPTISVPSIVIAGADDHPFLIATDYMAKKIPGAQKVIIPNAGHAANIDQPAAFNAAVLAFLDRLD